MAQPQTRAGSVPAGAGAAGGGTGPPSGTWCMRKGPRVRRQSVDHRMDKGWFESLITRPPPVQPWSSLADAAENRAVGKQARDRQLAKLSVSTDHASSLSSEERPFPVQGCPACSLSGTCCAGPSPPCFPFRPVVSLSFPVTHRAEGTHICVGMIAFENVLI